MTKFINFLPNLPFRKLVEFQIFIQSTRFRSVIILWAKSEGVCESPLLVTAQSTSVVVLFRVFLFIGQEFDYSLGL